MTQATSSLQLTVRNLSPALEGAKAIGEGAKAAADPMIKEAIRYFIVYNGVLQRFVFGELKNCDK